MAFMSIGVAIAGFIGGSLTTGAIVATIAGVGLTASGLFVASAIAIGLSVVTAKIMAPGAPGGGGYVDNGVRVQLPPNSELKVPVVYGHVFQQGIITDAEISNQNKTMTYVLTLSEKTDTGTWSSGDIYWNDQKLNFKADGYTVASSTITTKDENGNITETIDTKLDGLVRVWIWAGNSLAANQLHGPSPAVNAYSVIPNKTSTYMMNGLVFAVIQVDYNAEKGTTGLPTITFELTNSCKNPADVWYDYATNTRYGAAITATNIDTAFLSTTTNTSFWSICEQVPANQTYISTAGTFTSYQKRYEINGIINTADTIKNNFDKINVASASWTTFDIRQGKWKVIPNSSATVAQLSSAFVFNDDNILGEIVVSATNLEDMYNGAETGFANRHNRDQTDFYSTSTAVADRNPLEPTNILNFKVDLANNPLNAGRIANIELRQSRIDLIISFTADYSALQVEAGDVVKVTSAVYGFTDKLFRVTRVREVETDDGLLVAEISALEYDSSVYEDIPLVENTIPKGFNAPPKDSNAGLPATTATTATYDINVENIIVETTLPETGYPVDSVEVWISKDSTGTYEIFNTIVPETGVITTGTTTTLTVPVLDLPTGQYYWKTRSVSEGLYSEFSQPSGVFDHLYGSLASGGVNNATNATNADNILTNPIPYLTTSLQYIMMTEVLGDYFAPQADVNTYFEQISTTSVKLYVGGHEVSTNTNAVYGQFLATGTQSISTVTSIQAVTFDESVYTDGITLTTGTHINLPQTGKYVVTFSSLFSNSGGQAARALMWLRKNGVDEMDTNTPITVPARHGNTDGTSVLTVSFVNEHNAGDYIELYWNAESTNISLLTVSSSTVAPIYPRSPAVVLSVNKIAGGFG